MDRGLGRWLRHAHPPEKMVFLPGPRQVGKTWLAKRALEGHAAGGLYLNWDVSRDRRRILAGEDLLAPLRRPGARPMVILDELHKMRKFKGWLKGFYDGAEGEASIWVTGSGRLDLYQRGGDSLLGRYFLYRMHPLSLGEIAGRATGPAPVEPDEAWGRFEAGGAGTPDLSLLLRFGGFPEPFLRQSASFHARWVRSRRERVTREDLRDLTRIQDLDRLERLVLLLPPRVGSPLSVNALREDLEVAFPTAKNWLLALERTFYVFGVRPWSRRIARALRQERKVYFWDWSELRDEAARYENLVLSHLRKACDAWTDFGIGEFEVWYLRDREKREADALVTRDGEPWLVAEAKRGDADPSPSLVRFAGLLGCPRIVQLVEAPVPRRLERTPAGLVHVAPAGDLLRHLP